MKKVEKDLLILGLVGDFLKSKGIKLKDVVPNYNPDEVVELFNENYSNNIEENLIIIAKECYSNIRKKSKTK